MHMLQNTSQACTCRLGKERSTLFFFHRTKETSFLWRLKKKKEESENRRPRDSDARQTYPRGPILLFHGEKTSDGGRFNALLIICKDVRNYLCTVRAYVRNRAIRLRNVQTISGNALADVESVLNERRLRYSLVRSLWKRDFTYLRFYVRLI